MQSMSQRSLTIVLPTYEEVESLPSLICAIEEVRKSELPNLSIIIVDDNSNDGTESLIEELGHSWIRLLVRRDERGLSSAVIRGLQEATTEYCIVMDADGSHPPDAIPATIQALEDGADFVIGSRYISGGSTEDGWGFLRWINSKVATIMARPFTSVLDPMSGFLAFRRSIFDDATHLNPVGYKIGLELIVKCGCINVVEVPIHFRTRQRGQSKLTLRVQWEYLRHVILLLRYTHPKLVSFFTFATVGASGAAVYIASLMATTSLIDTPWRAIAAAVWIAMTWNFIWDRKYAFWYARHKSFIMHYLGFVCVCSVGAVANFNITLLLSKSEAIPIAGLVGVCLGSTIGIVFNYFVNRLLVFRK